MRFKFTKSLIPVVLASMIGACGEVDGMEREPELRVTVEERTVGEWMQRVESGPITAEAEALRAGRALQVAMRFDHFTIARRAADGLQALAEEHAAVLPVLVSELGDERNGSRFSAYVKDLGESIEPVVPALVEALGSDEERTRIGAQAALSNAYRFSTPYLEEALASSNERRRDGACSLLSRYSGKGGAFMTDEKRAELAPVVVARLVELLRAEDPQVRGGAAPSIGAWREHAAFAADDMLAAFEAEENRLTRVHIFQSLHQIGKLPRSTIEPLLAIVVDPRRDPGVVSYAAQCLRAFDDIGPGADAAAAQAIVLLDSDDVDARKCGAMALGGVGSRTNGAVPALVALLVDEDAALRGTVVGALATMGPEAAAAVEPLRDLQKTSTGDLLAGVRRALECIEPGTSEGHAPDQKRPR